MKLDLRPMLRGEVNRMAVDFHLDVEGPGDVVFESPAHIVGQIVSDGGYMQLLAEATLPYRGSCARCLESVEGVFHMPFERVVVTEGTLKAEQEENNVDEYVILDNGIMDVELKGVSVRLNTVWNLEAPAGGGDMHRQVARGTKADIFVEQGPDTEFKALVLVKPQDMSAEEMKKLIENRMAELGYTDAAVSVYKDGRLLVTPPSCMVDGHEFHFAIVRDEFLQMLATGKEPGGLRTQLVSKYKLMAMARDMALNK
jgi:hypothetical protein